MANSDKTASSSPVAPSPSRNDLDDDLFPDAENAIEPDSTASEEDYATDSDSAASTSLASSVRDHVFENNRRFHKFKEGRYLLPNDEPEQEREDMKHAMVLHVCDGKLHFSPLENPQKILDVGTGTGAWAIDMGDEFPGAEVVGIDLSPIQPPWVPPNVKFYVDDAESDWVDAEGSLDLVHARHVCMGIKDWPRLLNQAYKALKPGGWIELQEMRLVSKCDDNTMPDDWAMKLYLEYIVEGFRTFGIDLLNLDQNRGRVVDAGFVNVEERVWKVPLGTWPRDPKMKMVGTYHRSVVWDALQGAAMGACTRGLKWSLEEFEVFLTEVRRAMMDTSVHAYFTFHVVYGQKPLR